MLSNLKYLCLFFIITTQLCTSQIKFENRASELGLIDNAGVSTLGGNGISFCDFDNDGWDDITFCSQAGDNIKFYRNNNGSFVEQAFNVSFPYQTRQINWVDIDNDGDKDMFVTSDTNGVKLFENNGSLSFTDITEIAGLPTTNLYTYGSSWGDIDNNGFLDLFISNRDETTFSTQNYLYKNNGDNTFTDISDSAGILTTSNLSFCAAFFDFDNDGWQDIYVANDKSFNPNVLYRNNGNSTFTEVGFLTGTDVAIDAMSTTIGDYNNDGWFDIYVSNTFSGNALLQNNQDGTFTDVANPSGTIFNSFGWGSVFLDAECDTDLDLYVSGSMDGSIPQFISAAFYENDGNGIFSIPNNAGFVGDEKPSHSNAIGDVNNDGLPDIVVNNNLNENLFLWRNETITTNNWLKIKLEGTVSNRDGIGSVIEISINGDKQYRYTLCGEGYLSQNSESEFFGLGANAYVDYVKIKWLSGTEDIFTNVTANQTLNVVEGSTLNVSDVEGKHILVYPNPTNSSFNVDLGKVYQDITISITNTLGQQIMNKEYSNTKNINIDLSNDSGVYFITITDGEGLLKTKRIIKR